MPPASHAPVIQLVHHPFEAVAFAEEVGFPLVAKPPAGAGAQATFRLDEPSALQEWLRALPPRGTPRPCSRFLVGEEHTFDSVTVNGQTVWASIADYIPRHWKSCAIRGSSGW